MDKNHWCQKKPLQAGEDETAPLKARQPARRGKHAHTGGNDDGGGGGFGRETKKAKGSPRSGGRDRITPEKANVRTEENKKTANIRLGEGNRNARISESPLTEEAEEGGDQHPGRDLPGRQRVDRVLQEKS